MDITGDDDLRIWMKHVLNVIVKYFSSLMCGLSPVDAKDRTIYSAKMCTLPKVHKVWITFLKYDIQDDTIFVTKAPFNFNKHRKSHMPCVTCNRTT